MITDPNRLITNQRVSHIPEGLGYFYCEAFRMEVYHHPWPPGFWDSAPLSNVELKVIYLKAETVPL